VRDEGLLNSGRIGIVLVSDEETAGPPGSRDLAARGILGKDGIGMLTPEPTGGVVWNANRGTITLRATMPGRTAHVGRQFEGVNAFERALPAIAQLAEIKKEVELRETQYNIAPVAARRSILLLGGRSEGGTNFNVTPDRFSFSIDRRINPEENLDKETRRLHDALNGFQIETLQHEPAAATSEDDSLGRSLSHFRRDWEGSCFRTVPGTARNKMVCGSRYPGVRLRTWIADGVPWTQRVRSDPQHRTMRFGLCAYGCRDVVAIAMRADGCAARRQLTLEC